MSLPLLGAGPSAIPAGGGATPWDFSDLTTAPRAWWAPPDEGTIAEADASGFCSSITDKSGNGQTLSQTTGTSQPATGATTQNGLNVLNFDGGDYLTRADALGFTGNPAITVFMAVNNVVLDEDMGFHIAATNSPQGETMRFCTTDNSIRFHNGFRQFDGASTGWHIYVFSRDAGDTYADSLLWMDGVARSEIAVGGGTNTPNLSDNFTMMGGKQNVGGSIEMFECDWGGTIVVPAILSTSDRQKGEGRLAHDLGLTGNLDGGHPYKSSPPTLWMPDNDLIMPERFKWAA